MSRIGIRDSIHQPQKKCFGCKNWVNTEPSDIFGFKIAGRCKTGYCKKDAITNRRKNK